MWEKTGSQRNTADASVSVLHEHGISEDRTCGHRGSQYKRYALIAGFTEIGETAEETVKREVMEEVGLAVKNIRYYKSQPWGFDSNLLLGYFCELAEEEEIHLDEEELSVAEWVDYHDVPEDREKLSLTHEMMTYFKEQRRR